MSKKSIILEESVRRGGERWDTESLCQKWNREDELKQEIVRESKYKRSNNVLMKAREVKNTEGGNLENLISGVPTLN